LPGVTPATMAVPPATMRRVCRPPSDPVMPWTSTREVSSRKIAILADPKVDAILVNIFGGITRGDEVARGLIEARAVQERDEPMVVRIVGTNAAEAAVLLEEAHFATAASLDEAAAKAVAASRGAAA